MDIRKEQANRDPAGVFCWACGDWIPCEWEHCPRCGSPVYNKNASGEADKVCDHCGQELKSGAKFCPVCGEKQKSASAKDVYPSRKITGGENGPDELGITREVYAPPEAFTRKNRDKTSDFGQPMGAVYASPKVSAREKWKKQKKPWARLFAKWRGEDK